MANNLIDLTGKKFGKLFVIERAENGKCGVMWKCQCDCGNFSVVYGRDLKAGKTKSCGHCFGGHNAVHGMSSSRLYGIWCGMKNRCYNKNVSSYYRYGGRGIKVCDEWKDDFQAFYNWAINNGYADNLTIERKNTDKDYCPENCEWVTMYEQNRNKSNSHRITCRGTTKILADWAIVLKINKETLAYRLKHSDLSETEVIENLLNKMEAKQNGRNKEK